MNSKRKVSRSLHRRPVLNYARQRRSKPSKEERRAKRLNNPLLKFPGRRKYGIRPEHDHQPVSKE